MTDHPSFDVCITMLRSGDAAVYEDGYDFIQRYLLSQFDRLVILLRDETDALLRGTFIELLGDSGDGRAIPILARELTHNHRDVRRWAYETLLHFPDLKAREIAVNFAATHPEEDFVE
jgi:hypothetical protein